MSIHIDNNGITIGDIREEESSIYDSEFIKISLKTIKAGFFINGVDYSSIVKVDILNRAGEKVHHFSSRIDSDILKRVTLVKNDLGQLHCENGPAVILKDRLFQDAQSMEIGHSVMIWVRNGLIHREGAPAIISFPDTLYYYDNHRLHRSDGPAMIRNWEDKMDDYFIKEERFDGPTLIKKDALDLRRPTLQCWYVGGVQVSLEKFLEHYPDMAFDLDQYV